MKYALVLLPIVLVGCKQGRQAAVSNDGRVASTVDSGTSVAGRGKIAGGGGDVVWSPDGQTLAVSTKDGTAFWPKGETIPDLIGPYAWSADGASLAGIDKDKVVVKNLQSGETREANLDTGAIPDGLGWTSEGWTFGWHEGDLAVEGGKRIERKGVTIQDAVSVESGDVAWIEAVTGPAKSFRSAMLQPLRLCRWTPSSGAVTSKSLGPLGTLLSPNSPRRISLPLQFALAPGASSVAVAGVVVEAGARTVERLKVLAEKKTTQAEEKEIERLLAASRAKTVVVRIDATGPT
ncbi:hypothetical protein EON82_15840, partial [bacterium]